MVVIPIVDTILIAYMPDLIIETCTNIHGPAVYMFPTRIGPLIDSAVFTNMPGMAVSAGDLRSIAARIFPGACALVPAPDTFIGEAGDKVADPGNPIFIYTNISS